MEQSWYKSTVVVVFLCSFICIEQQYTDMLRNKVPQYEQ